MLCRRHHRYPLQAPHVSDSDLPPSSYQYQFPTFLSTLFSNEFLPSYKIIFPRFIPTQQHTQEKKKKRKKKKRSFPNQFMKNIGCRISTSNEHLLEEKLFSWQETLLLQFDSPSCVSFLSFPKNLPFPYIFDTFPFFFLEIN